MNAKFMWVLFPAEAGVVVYCFQRLKDKTMPEEPCLALLEFSVVINSPTQNETVNIPPYEVQAYSASVTYRVRWLCEGPPPSIDVAWVMYWNGNQINNGTPTVNWSGMDGVASDSPSQPLEYTS